MHTDLQVQEKLANKSESADKVSILKLGSLNKSSLLGNARYRVIGRDPNQWFWFSFKGQTCQYKPGASMSAVATY